MNRTVSYLRTSSAANVEGDSAPRQDAAVMAYAKATGLDVVACFWDAAVSGKDPIESRAGFAAILDLCEAEDIKVIIVESPDRFARDMMTQELGVLALIQRGIRLLTATGLELTDNSDDMKVMFRQIAASFAQFEKARLVRKLKGARDRASEAAGKRIEGRKSYCETNPKLIAEAKRLARKSPKTGKSRPLREIASELAGLGYATASGKPFSASQVNRLLGR